MKAHGAKEMNTFLVTGATSGLGLEVARNIATQSPHNQIVTGVRVSSQTNDLEKAVPKEQLNMLELDLSSVSSVLSFAESVKSALEDKLISGLALNAGLQIVSGTYHTEDGYEKTFATNVLGHIILFRALQSQLTCDAVVVSTSSGTHDPEDKLATSFGFRGGFFPSIEAVAVGDVSDAETDLQAGLDRYATSKLCNVLFTYACARTFGENDRKYVAFDPGLMPATGLARDRSSATRLAWKNVLPTASKLMEGASSAKKSGSTLTNILLGNMPQQNSGVYVNFKGNVVESSKISHDKAAQDALIAFAEQIALQ